MIEFENVSVGYGGRMVLNHVSFTARDGEMTVLLGPNGCGKTTLLRAAAGQLAAEEGKVKMNGRDVREYGRMSFARTAAFVPQHTGMPDMTVGMLVSHGRFPHLGMSRTMRECDREAVEKAMAGMGIESWKERNVQSLSGGERQLAYLAMALAQETPVLLLDEPTAFLDIRNRFLLIEKLRLLAQHGKTVAAVLHDLPCAMQYADHLVLLADGRLQAQGTPDGLFESRQIDRVFGAEMAQASDRTYYLRKKNGTGDCGH